MVSLVGKLIILVYFLTQVNTVLSRGNMSINYSLKQKNLSDLNDPSNLLRITNDNFTMALRVQQINPTGIPWFDPSELDRYISIGFG